MTATAETLHQRLRAATRTLHDAVEGGVDMAAALSSVAAYCRLLRDLWRLHAGYEACLAGQPWAELGIDYDSRRRAPLLRADLAALGDSAGLGQPVAVSVTGLHDALGCLYVLEGSTLGNQVLLRAAEAALGLGPDTGARFLHGYGAETGAQWRRLTQALDGIPAAGPAAEAIEAGARRTFETFSRTLGTVSI
jgi:heme oxygenase